jgi:hypothetical protein
LNLPSFFVEVDYLARLLALISAGWLGRLQGAQLAQPQALEHAADGGGRDADGGRDLLARYPLAPRTFNPLDHLRWRRLAQSLEPRAAVVQALQAVADVATDPFTRSARANACGVTGGLRRLPAENHFDQPLSTERRQTGILVDVHSALSQGSLKSRQPQLPRTEPDGQPIESSHLEQAAGLTGVRIPTAAQVGSQQFAAGQPKALAYG